MTDNLIKSFMAVVLTGKYIDPVTAQSIGIKNIHFYRTKFIKITNDANLSPEQVKILIQIMMGDKNQKRLMKGLKVLGKERKDPDFKAVALFIEKSCVNSTLNQVPSKFPSVKIAESFPDVCSMLFVTTAFMIGMIETDRIYAVMIKKPWFASLDLDPAVQEENKKHVREMWDSWGNSGGKVNNTKGEKIAFVEEYYENQANDSIELYNADGNKFSAGSTGYTEVDIKSWISAIGVASQGKTNY
jgi:hypothetical protein